jgi:hypothetical protein
LPDFELSNMEVVVSDLSGKIVYKNIFENSNASTVDVTDISKGLYLVQIKMNDDLVDQQKISIK